MITVNDLIMWMISGIDHMFSMLSTFWQVYIMWSTTYRVSSYHHGDGEHMTPCSAAAQQHAHSDMICDMLSVMIADSVLHGWVGMICLGWTC